MRFARLLCVAMLSVVEPSLILSARGWPRTSRLSNSHRTRPRMAGFVTPRSELTPREPQPQTITLTGCMDGVGVGLDTDNCVDMLTPGKPAAAVLQLGDKVTTWNGIAMFDAAAGERRLLKEVVTAAESHTLVIERAEATAAPVPVAAPPDMPVKNTMSGEDVPVLPTWSSGQGSREVSKPRGIDTDDDTLEAALVAAALIFTIIFIAAQPAVRSWF